MCGRYASSASQELLADTFELDEVVELPPTQVKGKAQALKIFNVIGDKHGGHFGVERTRPA